MWFLQNIKKKKKLSASDVGPCRLPVFVCPSFVDG